jgi:prepilin-type processing-associated H-X9-DG protein
MEVNVQGGVVTFTTTNDPNGASYSADFGICNYAANYLVFGGPVLNGTTWDANARIPLTFKDGTSNTLLFCTKYAACTNGAGVTGGSLWGGFPGPGDTPPHQSMAMFAHFNVSTPQIAPRNGVDCDYTRPQAFTSGGAQVAFGDGSARNVNASIDSVTWSALCTPAARDYVPGDF